MRVGLRTRVVFVDEIMDELWEKAKADPDLPFVLVPAREGASFEL